MYREMYWSDWGTKPEIARSLMDGTQDISFVSNNIRWPNGLTIDYPNQRLYWVDAKFSTIESILLDGTDRRVILADVVRHPYAIAVFEDKLYWSDWATHSIQYCDKFTGKNHHTLIKEKRDYIYGIHVYHSALKQRMYNPCSTAYCSDLCLLSGSASYACACTEERALGTDKHTCRQQAKNRTLAVSVGHVLLLVHHQTLGRHNIEMLPMSFTHIDRLAYDSIAGAILVSNAHTKQLYSINVATHETRVLLSKDVGNIGGMDFGKYHIHIPVHYL